MKCAYASNVGIRRKQNQDAYLAANFEKNGKLCYIFAVADGLGGHLSGEVASKMAVDYIKQHISGMENLFDYGSINRFVNDINNTIIRAGADDPEKTGMATTLTMCVVEDDHLGITHIGDSRAYSISPRGIEQLTKDHSLVQVLLDEGKIQSSQVQHHPQKNVITRALGTDIHAKADFYEYTIHDDEIFLICSDGLYNMVSESMISDMVLRYEPEEAVKKLIDLANENGGNDNITVVIFEKRSSNNSVSTHRGEEVF